ncbi:fimbrial protein [Klebsiella aerogenes]|nr:fimbrial protein [Klebsiella aerogenes]HEO1675228.1 fimbrial protein [Klebsiella aerogenes]
MTRYGIRTLTLVFVALFCSSLLATGMQFTGTLVEPPPCTINGDQPVYVDFGKNVGVNKVDGVNYIQPVNYNLTCGADSSQEGMSLVLSTTDKTSYDEAAINTSITGLGIRLMYDGEPVVFGDAVPVSMAEHPLLQAVPVKAPDAKLDSGPFEASLTLQVVYQ